jgi:membrane protease YdiL (CAAX protease family)
MTDSTPVHWLGKSRLITGSLLVVLSMAVMLTLPSVYFVGAAFVSTTCMFAVAVALGGYRSLFRPSLGSVAGGLASAALLYLIFVGGNLGITLLLPFGIGTSNENSIYSLIASPANPVYVQLLLLLFDSTGYESFFRGILQRKAQPLVGLGAPFIAAIADASIHVLTLNPLWVVATFIVDVVWGLTYYYSKDLTSSMTSHFAYDVLIFVLFPIR